MDLRFFYWEEDIYICMYLHKYLIILYLYFPWKNAFFFWSRAGDTTSSPLPVDAPVWFCVDPEPPTLQLLEWQWVVYSIIIIFHYSCIASLPHPSLNNPYLRILFYLSKSMKLCELQCLIYILSSLLYVPRLSRVCISHVWFCKIINSVIILYILLTITRELSRSDPSSARHRSSTYACNIIVVVQSNRVRVEKGTAFFRSLLFIRR